MRRLVRGMVCGGCLLALGGCTPAPESRAALDREVARWAYLQLCGPAHVAAIVGVAAAGGPSGLGAVASDYGPRAAFAAATGGELPDSPLVPPDSGRPVQFGTVGRSVRE